MGPVLDRIIEFVHNLFVHGRIEPQLLCILLQIEHPLRIVALSFGVNAFFSFGYRNMALPNPEKSRCNDRHNGKYQQHGIVKYGNAGEGQRGKYVGYKGSNDIEGAQRTVVRLIDRQNIAVIEVGIVKVFQLYMLDFIKYLIVHPLMYFQRAFGADSFLVYTCQNAIKYNECADGCNKKQNLLEIAAVLHRVHNRF